MIDHSGGEKLRCLGGNTGGSPRWRARSYFKGAWAEGAEVPPGDSEIGEWGSHLQMSEESHAHV